MTKPIQVNECPQGVELQITKDLYTDCTYHIKELLTVEEAEALAEDLLNAAQDVRMVNNEKK